MISWRAVQEIWVCLKGWKCGIGGFRNSVYYLNQLCLTTDTNLFIFKIQHIVSHYPCLLCSSHKLCQVVNGFQVLYSFWLSRFNEHSLEHTFWLLAIEQVTMTQTSTYWVCCVNIQLSIQLFTITSLVTWEWRVLIHT